MSDWYVRPSGGSYGAEDGTSYDNAWDGFSNITWGSGGVEAGDTLWVCGTHYEQLTVGTSGTSGNEITISGGFSGDNGVINNITDISGVWTLSSGQTYTYQITDNSANHRFVCEYDIDSDHYWSLIRKTSIADVEATAGSFYLDTTGHILYVHAIAGGSPNTNGYTYGYNSATDGIDGNGHTYIKIDDVTVVGANDYGIFIDNAGCVVENCTITLCYNAGIRFEGSNVTSGTASNNIVKHCGNGIRCYASSSGVVCRYNTISYIGYNLRFTTTSGTFLDGESFSVSVSSNITFTHNSVDKIRRGITYYTVSAITGGEISYNQINDFTYGGITIAGDTSDSWTDLVVNNNTVVSSLSPPSNGIYLASPSTDCIVCNNYIEGAHNNIQVTDSGWAIKNNISVQPNGSYHFVGFAGQATDADVDYNCYYHTGTKYWKWNGGAERTVFTDYQADANPNEAHSINSDPLLTSSYRLGSDSPCVGAGTIVTGIHDQSTVATDIDGNGVYFVPSIGASEPRTKLYFDSDASAGGNGTRANPYHAISDYTWTGYNVRKGGIIRLKKGATDYAALDLSGLTDTEAIAVEVEKGAHLLGFVTNGDGYVCGLGRGSSGLSLGLGLSL